MKNILLYLLLLCTINVQAQTYIQLPDNTSFDRDRYQADLDAAAKDLVSVFEFGPDTSLQSQFKVFDFGFYLHKSKDTEGIPETFEQAKALAANKAPYYLLFAKQSDETGLYREFLVDLKLPEETMFPCFDGARKSMIAEMAEQEMNKIHEQNGKKSYKFADAEKAGMGVVQGFLKKFIDCCPSSNARSSTTCTCVGIDTITTALVDRGMLYFDVDDLTFSNQDYGNIDSDGNILITNNSYPWALTDELSTLATGMSAAKDSIKVRYFDDISCFFIWDYLNGKDDLPTATLRNNNTSDFFHEVIVLKKEGVNRVFFRFSEDARGEILDKWGLKLVGMGKPSGLYGMGANLFFEKCFRGEPDYISARNKSSISNLELIRTAFGDNSTLGVDVEKSAVTKAIQKYTISSIQQFEQINLNDFMIVAEEAGINRDMYKFPETALVFSRPVGKSLDYSDEKIALKNRECLNANEVLVSEPNLALKIINQLICLYRSGEGETAQIDLVSEIGWYSGEITLFDNRKYLGINDLGFRFAGTKSKGTVSKRSLGEIKSINVFGQIVYRFPFDEGGSFSITTTSEDAIEFEKLFNIDDTTWDAYFATLILQIIQPPLQITDNASTLILSAPKCALSKLNYDKRLALIDYFLEGFVPDEEENIVLDLIATCPLEDVNSLMTDLQALNRIEKMFASFHNGIGGQPNFNRLGTELSALYYRQTNIENIVEQKGRDATEDKFFFLAKRGEYTYSFSGVDYKISFSDEKINIKKNITVYFGDAHLVESKAFAFNPYEIVNVKIGEGFPNLPYKEGEIIPMPWVFCAYLAANYQSEQDIQRLLIGVDLLAFAIGVGEINTLIRTGRLATLRGFFAVAETVKLPLDAAIMSAPQLCGAIENKEGGAAFCKTYQQLSLATDVLLLSGTALMNNSLVQKAQSQWKKLNDKNPNLIDEIGPEQHHNFNRLFGGYQLLRDYWGIVRKNVSFFHKEVADWLNGLYLKGKVKLGFAADNPKKIEVYYVDENKVNHKIATGDTDGNFEQFDNGIMNGDFEAGDIKQTARQDAIVCVNNKCGIIDGACFVAGTLIQTPNGKKPIEQIQVDDLVNSYDTKNQTSTISKVKKVFKRGVAQIYKVFIGNDAINTTAEHPFYTKNGWTPANKLKKGIKILSLAGAFLAVDTVFAYDSLATVYNFEVEKQHNYFVGEEGLLAHNTYIYLRKISLGGNDLSDEAIYFRSTLGEPTHGGNIAVYEVEYPDGRRELRAFTTEINDNTHAEKIGAAQLEAEGIGNHQIKRIYSELEPCELGSQCKQFLNDNYPDADLYYSYDYPGGFDDIDKTKIRRASISQRENDLKQIFNGN